MIIFPLSWWQTNKNDWYLVVLVAVMLLSSALLFYLTGGSGGFLITAGLSITGFAGCHYFLRRRMVPVDRWMFPLVSMLISLGLIFIYRLAPHDAWRQMVWLLLGLIICGIAANLDYRYYRKYYRLFGAVVLIILAVTVVFGKEVYGARSWLALGNFTWQPSEPAKVLLILFFAGYAVEGRRFWRLHLTWVLVLALLVLQKDLGTAFIFFGLWIFLAYVAGERPVVLGGLVLSGILFAVAGYFSYPHLQSRLTAWWVPWQDPNGAGYQIIQALCAYKTGGLVGTGLGLGQPHLIPAVSTDFIFAAVGEEMGLLGTAGLMICFILLVAWCFRVAFRAGNTFGTLVAAGIGILIGLEFLVIVGGVTRFIPLTGITLPFVSYGGSSLVTGLLMMGILFNIASVPEG